MAWLGLLLFSTLALGAQTLPLAARPDQAPGGSELVTRLAPLGLAEREQEMLAQVALGNVPNFLRHLCPVLVTNRAGWQTNTAT